MLNDASVASAGSYVRTCRRIRNSKKIATIRDFHQNIRVNPTKNKNTYHIAVCTCVQLPFNKHTSCLYNRYWSICIHVQVELCPSWSSCINCYCISNGKMWKDSTQIFLSYLSCAEATWYHTKMLTINCPSTWASLSGLWLWSFFRFLLHRTFQTELWSCVII